MQHLEAKEFSDLVILAVYELARKGEPFTAHDVTRYCRRSAPNIFFDHERVKLVVHTAMSTIIANDPTFKAEPRSYPGGMAWTYYAEIKLNIPYIKIEGSSVIDGIYFNPEENLLYVRLNNGKEYHYEDVSYGLFIDFMRAPSKGRFWNEHFLNQ